MLTILLLCLPLRVQNEAKAVQLLPQVRSLAQLAGELSAQGVKVQCDTTISNRLALVCVKDRAWNSLRPLLEQGLEVRFIQKPEGAWTLTADAGATLREKTLRDLFVTRYETNITSIVTQAWNAGDELRQLNMPAHDQKEKELQTLSIRPVEAGGSPAEQNLAQLSIHMQSDNTRQMLYPVHHPFDLAGLLNEPRFHYYGQEAALNNSEEGRWVQGYLHDSARAYHLDASQARLTTRLNFDLLTLRLTENLRMIVEPSLYTSGYGYADFVPGEIASLPFTLRDIFREAGHNEALTAREQATTAWLRTPEADKSLALTLGEYSLSAAVQKWSRQSAQEVIMEVSPIRDILPGWNNTTSKLNMTLSRALDSGHALAQGENIAYDYLRLDPNKPLPMANSFVDKSGIALDTRLWTVAKTDQVALIHNEMNFLDNAVQRNPSAALALTARRERSADHLLTLDDLLSASRLLSARDNAPDAMSSLFNGCGDFVCAYPLLRFLDASEQREAMLKELAAHGKALLDCRTCTLQQMNTLVAALQTTARMARSHPDDLTTSCFYTDYPQWLRQGILEVSIRPTEFGTGIWMTFTLSYKPTRQVGQTEIVARKLWEATVGPVRNPQVLADGKLNTESKTSAKP